MFHNSEGKSSWAENEIKRTKKPLASHGRMVWKQEMISPPVRLQLSRRRGFRLQEHSRSVNGLGAVNVSRPSKWGNQFVDGVDGSKAVCVAKFREWMEQSGGRRMQERLEELRSKNLACYCKPLDLCHADVLLEMANK